MSEILTSGWSPGTNELSRQFPVRVYALHFVSCRRVGPYVIRMLAAIPLVRDLGA